MDVKLVDKEVIYKGKRISLAIYRYSRDGKVFEKEVVIHPGAVVIVPQLEEKLVLVRQYRPALDEWIIEFPAGTLERGEDPRKCAERELLEETGYKADKLVYLGEVIVSPGYSTEKIKVFLAYDLEFLGSRKEPYEILETVFFTQKEIEKKIRRNELKDSKTIAAYYLYKVANSY